MISIISHGTYLANAEMKEVKLARKHDPGAKHDDESNDKTTKVESSALRMLDRGASVSAGSSGLAI
jgi:hypothetical protein